MGALRQLQKTQRIATLAITGALRTTPTDLLDAHAGTLPMEFALQKAAHRAIIRMLTLPPTHPIHSIIASTRANQSSRHPSPIANLVKTFKLETTKLETIIPPAQLKKTTPNYTTKIANTREDSIEHEKRDDADFKVFSDGSGINNGIGAAAVIYKRGNLRPIKQLKAYLGPSAKFNTYEAEIVGAILAAWIIREDQRTTGKRVTIYIDNQAVIMALINPTANPGQHLIRYFNLIADEIGAKIEIRWISSHSLVKGNEKVDKLAKDAALGRSSRRAELPYILKKPLPVSASATKQEFLAKLKRKWTVKWTTSGRSQRMATFDDSFPFNKFRERSYYLSRNQASLMLQLRSGHIPLNKLVLWAIASHGKYESLFLIKV